jgi:hypothetical protein
MIAFFPNGQRFVPFLDRSELIHYTPHTVLHNLLEGLGCCDGVLSLSHGLPFFPASDPAFSPYSPPWVAFICEL